MERQTSPTQSTRSTTSTSNRMLTRYSAWVARWHNLILVVSIIGTLVGGYYSVLLYKNLRTDMEELLPETAQSVQDLKKATGRIGGLNHISVIATSNDTVASRRFINDVVDRLSKLPPRLVARVKNNIVEEREFFSRNRALYVDLEDWEKIERYVRERIRFERKAKNPFSLGLDEDSVPRKPEFDFDGLKKKYAERQAGFDRFADGYFTSRDGRTNVVLAFLPGKVTDIGSNRALSRAAHRIVEELKPTSYAADMQVGFSGDVQNVVEEHEGLVEDLITSSITVTVLVLFVLLVYYRTIVGVYALMAALFGGVAWTFGLSYWLVGYLNANTAFLGSIVIGNGINFGIIMLARYIEERRLGMAANDALSRGIEFTAQATWTAALAAGLSYGSLVLTDFRGFNQFGIIGGIGMVLCWLASFTTLPAMLVWFEHRGWFRTRTEPRDPVLFRAVSNAVLRAHKPILFVTLSAVVVSAIYVSRLSRDSLEVDFSKLRNKRSMQHGSGFWGEKVDAVFGRYLTPTIVLTDNEHDAGKVAAALRQLKKRDGDASPVADIKTIQDFLPEQQERKLHVISEIKERLPKKLIAKLSAEDRKMVDELLPKQNLRPLVVADLPDGVSYSFKEMNGTLGRIVQVYPRLAAARTAEQPGGRKADENNNAFWDGREVIRFADTVREAEKIAAVPATIAGQAPLSADMISAIANDGPKATGFAFLAVMVLVILVFPKWDLSRSILGALLLGVLWMGGVMGAFNLKINFLNFIALPITFGIGVDYAVNIFSRYRLDGARSIGRVIESTGGAVALCSATTIIGYSSLLLAGSQAFVSFGILAVLGEITCLTAAIVAFPAIWHFFEERGNGETIVPPDAHREHSSDEALADR